MNISVLGPGRWGTFIAWYLNRIGHSVNIWGKPGAKDLESLARDRKNQFLSLDKNIKVTDDLSYSLNFADILVISVYAQSLRELIQNICKFNIKNKAIVLCMKGIEDNTGKRLTQVIKEFTDTKTAIWVGPGHVQDFVKGIPNCMVIDSENYELKTNLIDAFSSDLIRFYIGNDLIGNEIGAAAKNVIGLAAGMLDAINYTGLKGALMSRGAKEISRIINALGGNENSAYGLCHLGDYQATLFSEHSQNRKFGEMYIKGEKYDKLAEGVATTSAILNLGEKHGVELPICGAVSRIIFDKADPYKVIADLFSRSLKSEV